MDVKLIVNRRSRNVEEEFKSGKRVWIVPSHTKDSLINFQRDVVIPLRNLEKSGAFSIAERHITQRGATFVERVEIVAPRAPA
jgi:hypothetical protein